jgi:FKBP-type peptidyl-prolyl cis-trans isomerase
MRRLLSLTVLPVLACLVLAGCGGASNAVPVPTPTVNANAKVTVSGTFGATPTVNIPRLTANDALTVKTVIQGNGPVFTSADSLVTNFVLYLWNGTSASLKVNTFTAHPTVIRGSMLTGLEDALYGKKAGSRVLAVIPPKLGYGPDGDASLGASGTTTLVFVVDLIDSYPVTASASGTVESDGGNGLPTISAQPGKAPVATFPSSGPPSTLVVKTLIKGTGPVITKGEYVVTQYTGYIWRTKKVFDSSWSRNTPFAFVFQATPEQVISGWDTGLAGQTVGSRVLLVIPPKDAYGKTGQSQAGINGTDVLVYVVDILGAIPISAS